jgi:F-type H+-transporting ATPase subunit gamma
VTQYVRAARELPRFERLDFIAVGKKGQQFLVRTKQNMIAAFPALSNHPTFKDVLPITRLGADGFLNGTYDHVVLLYADFVSALVQEPKVRALLPFSKTELKEMLASLALARRSKNQQSGTDNQQSVREYLFEPSQEEVLRTILPQLTEVQVYQAVLEAAASEHSARMVAMRNATDNATDILDDLTLTYNQTRQANITAELSELSASKAALEGT